MPLVWEAVIRAPWRFRAKQVPVRVNTARQAASGIVAATLTPRRALSTLTLALALGLLGTGRAAAQDEPAAQLALDPAVALRTSQAAVGHQLADYALLDAQGQPVRLSSYRGKPLLVSFIYTACSDRLGCPLASLALQSLQARVKDEGLSGSVTLLSISFDRAGIFRGGSAMA